MSIFTEDDGIYAYIHMTQTLTNSPLHTGFVLVEIKEDLTLTIKEQSGIALKSSGDGTRFLANDGAYKEIPSQSTFSDTSAIFEQSATYTDFPYQSRIALEGVTANDFVEVVFGINEALSGNYAPICLTENGYVTIYSKVSDTITIPTIIIHR